MRTVQLNACVVLPISLAQTVVYLLINHHPRREPCLLPLTAFDASVPFWSWSLWPYFGLVLGQIALALAIQDRALFRRAVIAYGLAMGTTLFLHWLWPTCIERPCPEAETFHDWAYSVMLQGDAPNSCFPSAHICGPMVIFWAYWRDGRFLGSWVLAALPVLSLTILTTKQHYLWDLVGGFALGGIAIAASLPLCRLSEGSRRLLVPRTGSEGD